MRNNPRRLGRGLNALIASRQPGATPEPEAEQTRPESPVRELPVGQIVPNPHQPRTDFDRESLRELAESIREHGVLQPIVVRPGEDGKYQLVAGERRWRAVQMLPAETIPAVVRDLSDVQSFEIALIENLQREDLTPLERATAYQHYLDTFGGRLEDLADRLSESRSGIANYLRLLRLHPEVCYMLGRGELGMGQARAIAGIADPQRQLALARLTVRRNLSVRQVEDLVRGEEEEAGDEQQADRAAAAGASRHLSDIEQNFSKTLGLRVRVKAGRKKNSGRVIINYGSLEEFDRIAERLGGGTHLD